MYNKIQDLTANLLTEVCHDMCVEPGLQLLMEKQLVNMTANTQDGIRLDIAASGVWGGHYEKTYFDVRILTHTLLPTGTTSYLSATGKMKLLW